MSVAKMRRELPHDVFVAMDQKRTLCAGLLLPGQPQSRPVLGKTAVPEHAPAGAGHAGRSRFFKETLR
jgi:hypothetical protein